MRRDDLDQFLSDVSQPCVSLFVSPDEGGDEVLHGRTRKRLRGLVGDAVEMLRTTGAGPIDAEAILDEAQHLLAAAAPRHRKGLALYLTPDRLHHHALADPVPERAVLADRPVLAPLVRELELDDSFLVLALDRAQPQLMTGTQNELRLLPDASLPSFDEVRERYDVDVSLQIHTGASATTRGAGTFHGHGAGSELPHDQLETWLRLVAGRVDELLADTTAPLFLVGVAEHLAGFRRHCSYRGLASDDITGSVRGWSQPQLHEQAWSAVVGLRAARQRDDVHRLVEHRGTGWVVEDLDEVRAVAERGQVDVLFVPLDSGEDERPVEDAIAATWEAGGTVHVLDGEVPGDGTAAAILRFARATG